VIYPRRNQSLCLTILSVLLVILCLGCGSSNNSMSNNSMSQAQAQAVAVEVSQAMCQALGGVTPCDPPTSEARPSLATAVRDIHPDASTGCNPNSSGGQTCNFPISLPNFACSGSQGGTISVTGDIQGTLDNTGAGSVSGTFTITPAECSVSNLILNGDPNINVAGQIDFTANETPAFPVTFTETGGISYGPNPSGSCQVNATYTISASLSCTISGTVCGQTVSGNC
jgi:hypothetical protein